ncbi:hypothetical protein HDV02_005255 [Globomyces sp. JEL0801]|nr:hypothetical protein HDV02_005255 [Globomyces sp. JEL0801]
MGNSSSYGRWEPVDDYTWAISALYALPWILYLTIEALARFKFNLLWITVVIAIPFNLMKCIVIISYGVLLLENEVKMANKILVWYYVFNIMVYLTQHMAMYQRKHSIKPERFYLDEIVAGTLATITTIGQGFCVMFTDIKCWVVGSNMVLISNIISLIYFDIYYCVYVALAYKHQSTIKERAKILLPCFWTIFNLTVYGIGVLTYSFGMGNFYTNAYWNLSCMIIPLLAIQSNISTSVQSFVRTASVKPKSHSSRGKRLSIRRGRGTD